MHLFCLQRDPIITIRLRINPSVAKTRRFELQQIYSDLNRCFDEFIFNFNGLT